VSPLLANQSPRIFRAPWVIPVTSAVLSDGAVVLDQDSIIAVGQYDDIVARFSDLPVTKCSGVILPALVNAHIHLDLSIYGPVPQESAESSMCDWISSLLKNVWTPIIPYRKFVTLRKRSLSNSMNLELA